MYGIYEKNSGIFVGIVGAKKSCKEIIEDNFFRELYNLNANYDYILKPIKHITKKATEKLIKIKAMNDALIELEKNFLEEN